MSEPSVEIVACTNGPLLVRGPARLMDASGEPIVHSRRTVALCRCGISTLKPFCDGSHKLIGFRTDPVPAEPDRPATSSGATQG